MNPLRTFAAALLIGALLSPVMHGPVKAQDPPRFALQDGDRVVLAGDGLIEGWTRDFVLIGDGWVKDGDYNTGFSKTVLPLPSHDDPAYATPPGRLEDDPVYRRFPDDWARYHTRYVTPERFQGAMRVE